MKKRNQAGLALVAAFTATGVWGANIVPNTGAFKNGEASLADPVLWGGAFPEPSANNWYLYVGDTFRYFMDGSDASLTNFVAFGSTSFSDRAWVSPGTPQHLTIDLYNGAKLKASSFSVNSGIDGTNGEGSSDHHIIVRDNAILEASSFDTKYDRMSIDVLSGGSLITTNGAALFGTAATTQAITWWEEPKARTIATELDAEFRIDNATWKTYGVTFGYPANYENIDISFAATNAVIDNIAGNFWFNDDSEFVFGPGTVLNNRGHVYINSGAHVTFDGATAPRQADLPSSGYDGDWWVGNGTYAKSRDTVLTLKGTAEIHPTAFITADNSSTSRVVVAENAKLMLDLKTGWYDYLRPSLNGVTYFDLRDNGRIELVDPSQCLPFRLGINAGSYGQFDMSGGTFEYYGYGLWVGNAGSGVLNVSGGNIVSRRILMGCNKSETATASFRQTGGTVRLANPDGTVDGENGTLSVAHAAHRSSVSLEGGVLECAYVTSPNSSYATMTVDGGTIRRYGTYKGTISDKSLIRSIGSFTVGEKGLTIDSNGADTTVKQTMSSVAGKAGFLRKVGAETLTLASGTYTLDRLVAAEGTLCIDETATVNGDTTLVVTNGAAFSLVGGATSVTLQNLVVTNGVIAIDPGDKIVVTGKTALKRLKVTFSTLPTVDEAADFLECTGELDDDTLQALRRAVFTNTLADGTHGALTATYDEKTGKTTVKVAVKTDVALTDETAWRGSGAWATAGNWSNGVPTKDTVAVFDKDSTSTDVTVGSGAVAGAFAFSGKDFVLNGDATLSMPAEAGSAKVAVASGHSTLNVPLSADAPTIYDVASNAALTVEKAVDGGGVVKHGYGRLELNADNAFLQPLTVKAGTLVAKTDGALGCSAESDNVVSLVSGTLATTNASDAAVTISQDVALNAETATEPLIVMTDADTTMTRLTQTKGAFIKRGVGSLTLPFAADASYAPDWHAIALGNNKLEFTDNGTIIKRYFNDNGTLRYYYAPFTVVEGELVLQPVGDAKPTVTIKNDFQLGRGSVGARTAGSMTIDGVTLAMSGRTLYHGFDMTDNETEYKTVLSIINGGKLTAAAYLMGEYCCHKCTQILAMTNGTIEANGVYLSGKFYRGEGCCAYTKDSTITATGSDGLSATSGFTGRFANTAVRATSSEGKFGLTFYSYGRMDFVEGSTFGAHVVTSDKALTKDFTLSFDASTWDVGDNDLTMDAALMNSHLTIETVGADHQMTVNVGADKTFAFSEVPLKGAGGLRVTGGGTVAFANGMVQFTGKMTAANGTIDLTNAGTIENAVIGGGEGTIKGGTFHNATIALASAGAAIPNFADCSFTGTTRVTVGGEAEAIADLAIANYTGAFSGIETFKLKGWKNFAGAFTAADGQIKAHVSRKGFTLLLR